MPAAQSLSLACGSNSSSCYLRRAFVAAIVVSSVSSFVVLPQSTLFTTCSAFMLKTQLRRVSCSNTPFLTKTGRFGSTTADQRRMNHKINTSLAAAAGKFKNFDGFCAEQEAKAIAASESWVIDATEFLEPDQSSALREILGGRADVALLEVGSYWNSGGSGRTRCVYANPDLGYDDATAESDYCNFLKIDNLSLSACSPWPNTLVKIGVPLEQVGDVLVVENESTVYLAVNPEAEKICRRLLPKELPGTGVTVVQLSREELDAAMATLGDDDGKIVEDMEVQRVDKRK
mmetsp:Transcript_84781/g.171927  ORF Transcript_84781/g.171927 Transcript_84781/m.171927 type:complete len:289 (-) Transcript_84781:427-1293(-)